MKGKQGILVEKKARKNVRKEKNDAQGRKGNEIGDILLQNTSISIDGKTADWLVRGRGVKYRHSGSTAGVCHKSGWGKVQHYELRQPNEIPKARKTLFLFHFSRKETWNIFQNLVPFEKRDLRRL